MSETEDFKMNLRTKDGIIECLQDLGEKAVKQSIPPANLGLGYKSAMRS